MNTKARVLVEGLMNDLEIRMREDVPIMPSGMVAYHGLLERVLEIEGENNENEHKNT